MFLTKWVVTNEDFREFVGLAFPGDGLKDVRDSIEEEYPSIAFDRNQTRRMRKMLRDSTFVCNKYQIYSAYKDASQVYAARYEIPPALHGSDLLDIIWNGNVKVRELAAALLPKTQVPDFLLDIFESISGPFATRYQRYFAGHALTGDPNSLGYGRGLHWDVTTDDGYELTNSMKMGLQYTNPNHPFFALGPDKYSSEDNCDFWDGIAEKISKLESKNERASGFNVQSPEQVLGELKV